MHFNLIAGGMTVQRHRYSVILLDFVIP